MKKLLLFLICLLSTSSALAQHGSIYLFSATSDNPDDTQYSSHGSWVVVGTMYWQFIHVYAGLSGATVNGVTGAEFYISGFEDVLVDGFQAIVTPSPESFLELGHPLLPIGEDRRYNIASQCFSKQNGLSFLASIRIFVDSPSGPPNGFLLNVVPGDPPSNVNFPCAWLTTCESIIFPTYCVSTSFFCVGGPPVPTNPTPATGGADVPLDVVLSWDVLEGCCIGLSTPMTRIYFGTNEDPPLVFTNYSQEQFTYQPTQELIPDTTYFWRIETTPDLDCGLSTGAVWSFTTARPLQVEDDDWGTVKNRYREE